MVHLHLNRFAALSQNKIDKYWLEKCAGSATHKRCARIGHVGGTETAPADSHDPGPSRHSRRSWVAALHQHVLQQWHSSGRGKYGAGIIGSASKTPLTSAVIISAPVATVVTLHAIHRHCSWELVWQAAIKLLANALPMYCNYMNARS